MTGALTLRRVPLMNIRAHPVRAAILLFFAFALAACESSTFTKAAEKSWFGCTDA